MINGAGKSPAPFSMLAELFLQSALTFLAREVPRWSSENHCYSCHNNGDAARALYVGRTSGYTVPAEALADTTAFLLAPDKWSEARGAPAATDKNLARIQFAAALAEAYRTGAVRDRDRLRAAADTRRANCRDAATEAGASKRADCRERRRRTGRRWRRTCRGGRCKRPGASTRRSRARHGGWQGRRRRRRSMRRRCCSPDPAAFRRLPRRCLLAFADERWRMGSAGEDAGGGVRYGAGAAGSGRSPWR